MMKAMSNQRLRPGGLCRSAHGAVLTELGLLLPVMAMLIFGALDAGHTLYMQSTIQGAVQKAARDSGLEAGLDSTNQAAIDSMVRNQIKTLNKNATVTFTRKTYKSFSSAKANLESFTDTNGNGLCDNNEPFNDENNDGIRNDGSITGGGSAKDSVLYTVTATYPRLFPLSKLIGLSSTMTLKASTIMNNQPFGDQTAAGVGHCP